MPDARRPRGVSRYARPFAITSFIAMTALVPLAWLVGPTVYRWVMLESLTASDPQRRESALRYVAARAETDEDVRAGAIERLDVKDDTNFQQIASALLLAGVWNREHVPAADRRRLLLMLAGHGAPTGRQHAARGLAAFDNPGDPAIAPALLDLAGHDNADVQRDAVLAAMRLIGRGGDAAGLTAVIRHGAASPHPAVARLAWLALGLRGVVNPGDPTPVNAPPSAGEAALWAAGRSSDAAADRLAGLIAEAHRPAPAALYALHAAAPDRAAAVAGRIAAADGSIGPETQLLHWRAALLAPPDTAPTTHPATRPATRPDQALAVPVRLARLHRRAELPPIRTPMDTRAGAEVLAALEGMPPGSLDTPLDGLPADPLLRLAAARAAADPSVDLILPALRSDLPVLRDAAVALAAERYEGDALEALLRRLYGSRRASDRVTAALLSGVSGVRLVFDPRESDLPPVPGEPDEPYDVLLEFYELSRDPIDRAMYRVALWLLDDPAAGGFDPTTLLISEDAPRSTVLLAMLHKGEASRTAALDWLLLPPDEPTTLHLRQWLAEKRWWYALRPHLPPDAPGLWLWADPFLQHLQLDTLRAWYVLQRG